MGGCPGNPSKDCRNGQPLAKSLILQLNCGLKNVPHTKLPVVNC
jgi:hypothetical protein